MLWKFTAFLSSKKKKASPKVVLENLKKLEYFDQPTQIHSLHPYFPTFIFSSFLKDPLGPVCVG